MKKLYILLFALLVINNANAQWFPQNSGTVNYLFSVYFTNSNVGYAVGDSGTILKTIDGGENWIPQNSGTINTLRSVHFPDYNTGYVVGEGGTIIKTTDGGENWSPNISGTHLRLTSVYFTDLSVGFAVSTDDQFGIIGGQILKTTDGGASWTIHPDFFESLTSIYFPDANTGYATSGSQGIIYKTIDGGVNWTEITVNIDLASVYFINIDTGYAVGGNWGNGQVIKTINGGESWTLFDNVTWWTLMSVYFLDPDIGYIVGPEILKTTNGGTDWTIQSSNTDFIYSVCFTDTNTGYAVGGNGIILKTTNGGGIPVDINEKSQTTNMNIFPNPANHTINLTTTIGSTIKEVAIYNQSGQKVLQGKPVNNTLDVSKLPAGMYIIEVKTMEGNMRKKLIIQ